MDWPVARLVNFRVNLSGSCAVAGSAAETVASVAARTMVVNFILMDGWWSGWYREE